MIFDHIGVVVRDPAEGRRVLSNVLGLNRWTPLIEDSVNEVAVQFLSAGSGPVYELVAPLGDKSPVAKALAEGVNLLNHVAYRVPDLAVAARRMRAERCGPVDRPKPAIAYGGRPIQFFITPLRLIVELIEAPGHEHDFAVESTVSRFV